jgi:pyruvate formate lyase activating enzyme
VAVTAGYICDEPRREFFAHMDAANIDLKAFSDDFYRKTCGGSLQPVLDTLVYLRNETDVWFEITTLLIHGANDSAEEIAAASRWVVENLGSDVPWHFTAFHPDYRMRDVENTPPETLTRARAIAREAGVHFVYTGNVYDPAGQSTFCPGCNALLIGRNRYEITDWALDDAGRCTECGLPCPGVFDAAPGTWGGRRLPVRLADRDARPN